MRVRLVVNPLSRRGGRDGEAVGAELRRLNVEIAEQASEPIDAIVVAGGDGTFAHQIPIALALGVPIGLVPLGTFNDLARTLEIPFDISGACALVATGRTRAIDVAKVNEAYYVTEASIGISSRLARRQRPQEKQRFGLLAVIASLFAAVRYARPFHAEIEYGGRRARLRAVQLTVANGPHFGGVITVADAAIDDGWLDCYVVAVKNLAEVIGVTGAILGGRRRAVRGLRTFRAPAFEVRTHKRHHITADGEPAGTTPARFEIHPKVLRVFAP
ncbi:MAG TPA: YegS/Rv2252/BmrU family lipid kinase [Candidatus Nitrosotalea sp.]|nr:YegS/Rv2252/BmrU family lipid kinase [Candidatus Nitrosotalea sp.]